MDGNESPDPGRIELKTNAANQPADRLPEGYR